MLNYQPGNKAATNTTPLFTDELTKGDFDVTRALLAIDGQFYPFKLLEWLPKLHQRDFWHFEEGTFAPPQYNEAEALYLEAIWREGYKGTVYAENMIDAFYTKLGPWFYLKRNETKVIEQQASEDSVIDVTELMYLVLNWFGMQLPMLRQMHRLGELNGRTTTAAEVRVMMNDAYRERDFEDWALWFVQLQLRVAVRAFCEKEGLTTSTAATTRAGFDVPAPKAGASLGIEP
jgi:hypothetical protein